MSDCDFCDFFLATSYSARTRIRGFQRKLAKVAGRVVAAMNGGRGGSNPDTPYIGNRACRRFFPWSLFKREI
jgi:hypothetical protein